MGQTAGHWAEGWTVNTEHRCKASRSRQCDLVWGWPEKQERPCTLSGCHKLAFLLILLAGAGVLLKHLNM